MTVEFEFKIGKGNNEDDTINEDEYEILTYIEDSIICNIRGFSDNLNGNVALGCEYGDGRCIFEIIPNRCENPRQIINSIKDTMKDAFTYTFNAMKCGVFNGKEDKRSVDLLITIYPLSSDEVEEDEEKKNHDELKKDANRLIEFAIKNYSTFIEVSRKLEEEYPKIELKYLISVFSHSAPAQNELYSFINDLFVLSKFLEA